jgi:hypothetical protein
MIAANFANLYARHVPSSDEFGQRLARNDCHPYPANIHAVLLLTFAHWWEHVAKANVVEMNAKPEIQDVFELRCLFGFMFGLRSVRALRPGTKALIRNTQFRA